MKLGKPPPQFEHKPSRKPTKATAKMVKPIKPKAKQSISCDIRVDALECWSGKDFWLEPNSTYSLVIDYPFNIPATFPIKVGADGMGLIGLLPHIGKAFDKRYTSIDNAKGAKLADVAWYWHGIDDLTIEGISVNHKTKKITLNVGS